MNKLLIGLLVLAAGTGIYFLVRKQEHQPVPSSFNKEQLTGTWASIPKSPNDSVAFNESYQFQSNGRVIHVLDSTKADTLFYDWKKDQLVLKQQQTDTIGTEYTITQLINDSLQLRAVDSTVLRFTRAGKAK